MEANELRIGNCLTFKGDTNVIIKLDRFDLSSILYNENEIDHYEPIELTEEILLKCGFKKLGKYTFVCNTSLMQLEIDVVNNIILHSILAIEVKRLHQLQNLYFALTGKELTINL